MDQSDRYSDQDSEDAVEEERDPWFRPVWEDLEDEADAFHATPLPRSASRPSLLPDRTRDIGNVETLLGPLAAAQDALARLDASAELVSPDLRTGLITRLAYTEAAGLLTARGGAAHPIDLALRDTERLGRYDLLTRGQTPSTPSDDWLELDNSIGGVLQLARLLQRLPSADTPLDTADRAQRWLGSMGRGTVIPFDVCRYHQWRQRYWPDMRRPDKGPALLQAAAAAAAWMETGITDIPESAQALAAAALLLRRNGTPRTIPLPFWSGWRGLCAPDDPGTLPRLRGDVAARLVGQGTVTWSIVFLHMVAEASRSGLRMLESLRHAEGVGLKAAKNQDKRSRLPVAVKFVIRQPAVTAPALAAALDVTHQAAGRLLMQLVTAGMLSEVTGRKSFRAFGIVNT